MPQATNTTVRFRIAGIGLLCSLSASGLASEAPALLSQTGLYADIAARRVAADVHAFSPQYPLWSDSATKQRWIRLPAGSAIDASQPDAWQFPVGTRLWKSFLHGQAVETRMIERLADGQWRFVSYAWRADGTDAERVSVRGARLRLVSGQTYRVPSEGDCRACHEGAASPVLGFSALQLSSDRDPLAPHAESESPPASLQQWVDGGWLQSLPAELLRRAPRIDAPSAEARAALGYLHGNCGHCHDNANDSGVPTGLLLAQRVADPAHNARVLASLEEASARFQLGSRSASRGELVLARMRSRDPRLQMPPLGTERIDQEAVALIQRWLQIDPATNKEASHVHTALQP